MNDAAALKQASRLSILKAWEDSGLNADDFLASRVQAKEYGVLRHLSGKTLYRWRKLLADSGPEALAPKYDRPKGAGALTLTKRDKALIQKYYLHQNQITLAEVVRMLESAEGIKIAYNTALRYIQSLPPAMLARGRYGQKYFADKFLSYVQRDYDKIPHSMYLVTSDHHCLDFLCRDGDKVFRPWVTIFCDVKSRKPLGWVLSKGPSGYTILSAMEMMIDEYGVPEQLLVDNGKDYRSQLMKGSEITVPNWEDGLSVDRQIILQGVLAALDCTVIYTEGYHGQSKPVERFFKDVAELYSKKQPTYLGSNTATRPEDAKKYAATVGHLAKLDRIPTFQEITIDWNNFINNWSATHPHYGQGMNGRTPDVVFSANWSLKRILPLEKKSAIFVRSMVRSPQRNGIEIDGIFYSAEENISWIGRKVIAKRPLRDVSKIFVHDLEGNFLFEAYPNIHIDSGMPEENIANIKKDRKKAKAVLDQYQEYLEDDSRDGMTAIQEAAKKFHPKQPLPPPPEEQEVVLVAGGVPDLPTSGRKPLSLVPKQTKSNLIGLLE
jgi:putative transposase